MGKIILLTLPIGNLGDLTSRVENSLKTGKYFLAEDTRNLINLMRHLDINTKDRVLLSFHDHTQSLPEEKIKDWLSSDDVYFVSDAGSPIISDPAYPLIQLALRNQWELTSYPGVSSQVMSLELSGLPPHPFSFQGFFPREKGKQIEVLEKVQAQGNTHVFFESPHRIHPTLELISKHLPEADVAVCRELTKKFEQVYRFKAKDFDQHRADITLKGEFCFCLYTEGTTSNGNQQLIPLAQKVLESKGKKKDLSKLLSKILGQDTSVIYQELNG